MPNSEYKSGLQRHRPDVNTHSFFDQRHRIWEKYSTSPFIWMTPTAWFGVTPELIADSIAQHVSTHAPKERPLLFDIFGGPGGNSIAFARSGHWKRVYHIEKDPAVHACARHNAVVYEVEDRITFEKGDVFEVFGIGVPEERKTKAQSVLSTALSKFGVVFGSPPWGGEYLCCRHG